MTFEISKEQYERYEEWATTHECPYHIDGKYRYAGAIGGADTFCFTPTGIGDIVIAKCVCGAEIDLTDEF